MIHEIAPHRYDNAFLQSAPGEGDAALYYEKDTILLCQEGKGWRVPQFSDLTLEAAEGAERLFSLREERRVPPPVHLPKQNSPAADDAICRFRKWDFA